MRRPIITILGNTNYSCFLLKAVRRVATPSEDELLAGFQGRPLAGSFLDTYSISYEVRIPMPDRLASFVERVTAL